MAAPLKMSLPSADDLFSTQDERDDARREHVRDIPLDLIDGFPDHPFQIRQDEAMAAMVESVKSVGVQTPVIARPIEGGRFELVSGHRRKFAAALAGLEILPVIVREMTRDEAIVAMVDANMQREAILPSEKAFSYKMKLDALSRQGKRTDLTCAQLGHKLKSRDIVAADAGESKSQVQRYIRLTELCTELLQLVDEGKVAFSVGVELSYLQEAEQATLLDAMQAQEGTPSLAQAIKMKQFSQGGILTPEVTQSIMLEEKPNQKEQFRMPRERISSYFPAGTPAKTIEDTIVKALALWQRQKERKREGPGLG